MRSGRARWIALTLILLAGCSRYSTATQASAQPAAASAPQAQTNPSPANPVATPSAHPTPPAIAVSAQPSPPSSQSATAAASAAPAKSALPPPVVKRVVIPMLSPDAPPEILSIAMSETTVHSGDTVSGTVLTTSNVASVEVRIANYGQGLTKTGVGRFFLRYPVSLPFFVRGTFDMRVIARNTRGATAQTTIPITVR